ncbi:uncharacterized protein TNCT_274881 [Trichonephila clavata]|uniref:Reverse transcriptase domain-containing protein n=1 Tax=Trichonephila clavata TaxID=2740835 RepID=A0A8X6M2W8_TRICU|nr:uncharacterized protein TNCT_274881 [Trichonephila clavata]
MYQRTNHITIENKKLIGDLAQQHLSMLQQKFDQYLYSINTEQYDWIRNPFATNAINSTEALPLQIREEFTDLNNDMTLKLYFSEVPLDVFWIYVKKEYPHISYKAILAFLPFLTTYLCEQSFSTLVLIKNDKRSCLKDLDQELRVALSNIEPNIKLLCSLKQAQYSKFVAGYLYGTEDETQMEITDAKNFTLDLKTLTTALSNVESVEKSSNDNKQKAPDQSSWEEIFTDAIHVIKEGIKLINILKTQDSKIQFQTSRLHLSWDDCFFKAVEIWKENLKKQFAVDDVLKDVAHKVKNKILGGNQGEAVRFEVEQSKVWTQKIFEVFHIHKQELAKAINIKKLEMKQGLTANLHIEFEKKDEFNPIYNIETTDIIKQGQRMFNIALDLKKKETKAMEAELNLLKKAGNQDDHDVHKIPKPLEIMQNIITTAIDFKKNGLQLPQQIKKVSKDLLGCPPVCLNQELDFFNSPFSHWELECGIVQFPQRKSVGPDGILPEFLAHLGNEAMGVLLKLINLTWASGIPSMWRKGEIIPILKVGKNPADLASFRPITLTCVMCKLTEHLIVRRLNYYLEKFHCISDREAGFRLYRNTTEQDLLFADNLVLWLADGDIRTTQESLNTALDALLTWSNNNEMTVNTSKTVFQVFTLSTTPKAIQLFYGDYQLQRTQEATYLGIVLDSRLS